MELADLIGAADVFASDEEVGEGKGLLAEEGLELTAVGGVHGYVALVDGDAEAAEDGADGGAVLVRTADGADGRGVEDGAEDGGGALGVIGDEVGPEVLHREAALVVVVVGEGAGEELGFLRREGG